MNKYLNKEIPAPVVLVIILFCALAIEGYVHLQYIEMHKIELRSVEVKILEKRVKTDEFADYTVLKEGDCGEVLVVKYIDFEVLKEEWSKEWNPKAIMEAAVFKEVEGKREILFSLDRLSMKDPEGKVFTPQVEANHGYAFIFKEEAEGNWYFTSVILDEEGKLASDEATLFWDTNKCDYRFYIAGMRIR